MIEEYANSKEFVKTLDKPGYKLTDVTLRKGKLQLNYEPTIETVINDIPGCHFIQHGGKCKIQLTKYVNREYKLSAFCTRFETVPIGLYYEDKKAKVIFSIDGINFCIVGDTIYLHKEGINCGSAYMLTEAVKLIHAKIKDLPDLLYKYNIEISKDFEALQMAPYMLAMNL